MRRPDLQPGGWSLWPSAVSDHLDYHQWRDYRLHHQRHHAKLDCWHGLQQPGRHLRNRTLQAIAYASGYTNSAVTSGVYTINGACATPTFNPAAGAYGPAQSVTISTTTGGESINYTTNGTIPSSTVGTVYSSPVSICATSTLQAIAYETGFTNSTVTSGVYTINGACATPTFSPAAGTLTTSTSVTSPPPPVARRSGYHQRHHAELDRRYGDSSAVSITATSTLQAIAYETGYSNSAVASGVYTIQCAAPTFNPAAGTYTTSTLVTITTSTSGATINYTTNGTTPIRPWARCTAAR